MLRPLEAVLLDDCDQHVCAELVAIDVDDEVAHTQERVCRRRHERHDAVVGIKLDAKLPRTPGDEPGFLSYQLDVQRL